MKKLATTLFLAAVICLSACSGNTSVIQNTAPTPEQPAVAAPAPTTVSQTEQKVPSIPIEDQKKILENNRGLWEFTEAYDSPWFYTFTDLDHNGRLEVIAATTQGTGIFTYANFYEVRQDGSGIDNCYHENVEIEGPDDWPEIVTDSLPCYHDAAGDCYFYACEGITREGYAHQYYAWYALCLKDGTADWEFIASKDVTWTDEGASSMVECRDARNNIISSQDYDSAVDRRFYGMEKTALNLDWTQMEIPWEDTSAESTESATTEQTAQEPVTQQQTLSAASSPQVEVVITKNPTSEALAIGGKTWFIAHADQAESLTWQLVDPEGQVYSVDSAMAYNPGLVLEVLEGDTIAVSNVPLSLNGWGIQARFDGQGNYAVTDPAYIYVGDFVTAYGSIIEKYRTAFVTGNNRNTQYAWDNGISEMMAYSSGVGYALKDLDKNGVPELIIAGMGTEDFSNKNAYDIYTLINDIPVNIATSQARMRYYIRTDSTILYEGSGGASYSYITVQRLNGSTLEDVDMIFTNLDMTPDGTYYTGFYYQQGHSDSLPSEKSVAISEEEFTVYYQQLESSIYVPPLTKIA